MKTFKGKALYNPSGKAGEYSYWACNFYTGCSNGCTYCYLRKGVLSRAMGGDKPTLKICFTHIRTTINVYKSMLLNSKGAFIDNGRYYILRDNPEAYALEIFEKELLANLSELQQHGLFFSFTSDPMIRGNIWLTQQALTMCVLGHKVPVKILTKDAGWVDEFLSRNTNGIFSERELFKVKNQRMIAFGFTLTGRDDMEPNASPNAERIEAMKKLHDAGFRTWASIEPIIDIESSSRVMFDSMGYCDLFKIGLLSGKKYDSLELKVLMYDAIKFARASGAKIYFKNSLIKQAGYSREHINSIDVCVGRDYNIFKI
jgi:DNA repair photolyase